MSLKKELIDLRDTTFGYYSKKSYSQEGEDMILNRIFEFKNDGFYVDVGAHHPMRFSNTYFFYRKGWRGINIDAMPGSMNKFNRYRPEDINLELAISNQGKELTYYMFNDPALNGFDERLSAEREKNHEQYHVIDRKKIKTVPLSEVLLKYVPENRQIDFLSIDVEGLDFEVLQSNDWKKFKPKMILTEVLDLDLAKVGENPVLQLLTTQGYSLYAKTVNTVFFRLN